MDAFQGRLQRDSVYGDLRFSVQLVHLRLLGTSANESFQTFNNATCSMLLREQVFALFPSVLHIIIRFMYIDHKTADGPERDVAADHENIL
jgi:hypothetical protein